VARPCPGCGADLRDRPRASVCLRCQLDDEYGERDLAIRELWEAGTPVREIADMLNLTEHAVSGVVDRGRQSGWLKLRHRRRRELWPLIRVMRKNGLTLAEIGEELETTGQNIAEMIKHMQRAGIDVPKPGGVRTGR